MPQTRLLPLFPLNIIAFPGEQLNLHVFEPRYRQLVHECYGEQKTFGIPTFINGKLGNYGTEVELLSIEKRYPNGEMDIKTLGTKVFLLHEFYPQLPDKLYGGGQVKIIHQEDDFDPDLQNAIITEINALYQTLNLKKEIGQFRSFDIAHYVGFSSEQEYQFLQINSERKRQLTLLEHLRRTIPIIIEGERLKEKIKLNGHFKKINPLDLE